MAGAVEKRKATLAAKKAAQAAADQKMGPIAPKPKSATKPGKKDSPVEAQPTPPVQNLESMPPIQPLQPAPVMPPMQTMQHMPMQPLPPIPPPQHAPPPPAFPGYWGYTFPSM